MIDPSFLPTQPLNPLGDSRPETEDVKYRHLEERTHETFSLASRPSR